MRVRLILLAAGKSTRFDSNKLLYELDGKPMFEYALDVMKSLLTDHPERELYVVTRFETVLQKVEQVKTEIQFADGNQNIRVYGIESPESIHGISYSIRAGILAGNSDAQPEYYLFMVADQPFIQTDTVERLIQRTTQGDFIGGCITWEDTLGNPVIFSNQLKSELLSLQGDRGGKSVLLKYQESICRIQAARESELKDLDSKNEIYHMK